MDTSAIGVGIYESIIATIQENLESSNTCQELAATWNELWDEEEINKRKGILAEECQRELREFLDEILNREKKTKFDYIERVETLLNEIGELQKSLEVAIPYEDVESMPLHNMAYHLNKKAEKYRLMRDERVNKYKELSQKEAALCEKLGMVPNNLNTGKVPTLTELKQLENQVAIMEQEKTDRTYTFLEKRQVICNLFVELGIHPSLNFEKEIITDEVVKTFKVTNENMNRLDELKRRLEEQQEEAKQTVSEIMEKLKLLWKYLEEPVEHQEDFVSGHQGHSVLVIKALREELSRCEKKKRDNISKIVGRIRQALTEEWDRCLISDEERSKFRPFYIDCFTEDLCDLHELEIEQLNNFYKENEQIFTLIDKQEKLFNRLVNLENGSKNANRYYNRGGQLLQEERERRRINKELPLVEDELKNLLKFYEDKHGKPFTAFGVPIEIVIQDRYNKHFDQKTVDKLLKKTPSGKSTLGKRPGTASAASTASKMSRLNTDKAKSAMKYATPQTPSRKNVPAKKKLELPEEKNNDNEPTYEDFQKNLDAKVKTADRKQVPRSTAMFESDTPIKNVLREFNTPAHFLRSATTLVQKTPANLAVPRTRWSPRTRTPKTLPRAIRRSSFSTPQKFRFAVTAHK